MSLEDGQTFQVANEAKIRKPLPSKDQTHAPAGEPGPKKRLKVWP